jgi:hypothetical protein
MNSQLRIAVQALGILVLVGLALICGFGFLASFEYEFPNGWHFLYGTAGMAVLLGAAWLGMAMSQTKADRAAYWRPYRLAALFSLFSVFAFTTGDLANLLFLLFLLFLLPIPTTARHVR